MKSDAPPAEASPRVRQALLALQNSRQALRVELLPPPAPAPRPHRAGAAARLWWRRLRAWPATHMLGEAVRQWWQRHPLQPLGDSLVAEARGQLWPLLRRHPWASVGVAAALGAATVAARPWRWAWVDRQVRRAPGAASGWLVRQLGSAPVQATLAGLVALLLQKSAVPPTAGAQAPAAHAPPPAAPDPATHGPAAAATAAQAFDAKEARHVVH